METNTRGGSRRPVGGRRQAAARAAGWRPALLGLLLALSSGCASLSNPVAQGVPVHRLPPQVLAAPRDAETPTPLNLLQQPPPVEYRVAPGDVLGVWVEGVIGKKNEPPPLADVGPADATPPGTGTPVPVQEDGTIRLPLVGPIPVTGLTLPGVEAALLRAYTVEKEILRPGKARISVSLLTPRTHRVVVMREDSGQLNLGAGLIGVSSRGTGDVIDLPAYQNDVLHALARTGGLPGRDAFNEVVVQRAVPTPAGGRTVCIPLSLRPGEAPPFGPADVVLQTGDVVLVRSREREVFYTGGLLPNGEHFLPRDYDLDVVEAVARVRGPLLNGAFSTNNLAGNIILPGLGNPSPSNLSVVRRAPHGQGQVTIRVDLNRAMRDPRERILVQPGDILILQETFGEGLARYLYDVANVGVFFRGANASGTAFFGEGGFTSPGVIGGIP